MNRATISAPSRWEYLYPGKFAAPRRLLLQIARVIVWLIGIVLALLVWRAANR